MHKLKLPLGIALIVIGIITATLAATRTAFAFNDSTRVPLSIMFRVQAPGYNGATDYRSVTTAAERGTYASMGAVYYIPQTNVAGTNLLYRLYNSGVHDSMDSGTTAPGWTTQATLGFPWSTSNAEPGTTQLYRFYNPTTYDHSTGSSLETSNWAAMGYTTVEGLTSWGYPRFGNAVENDFSTTAGDTTVTSNLVAGGAVWQWIWQGHTFINDYDDGRQMQTAVVWNESSNVATYGPARNPTEAGDFHSNQTVSPQDRHGSPLASAYAPNNYTQSTRAVPLEWDYNLFGGATEHPVLYKDMVLGKDLTLNIMSNSTGSVAKYVTYFSSPVNFDTAGVCTTPAQCPAPHIGSVSTLTGNFNRFYTYDATGNGGNGLLNTVTISCSNNIPGGLGFGVGYGGVINATADGSLAQGWYGVSHYFGGSVSDFGITNGVCLSATTGQYDNGFSSILVNYRNDNSPALMVSGTSTYTWYVVTGTLSGVTSLMHSLYVGGYR